jgi:hypothetical protein
MNYTAFGCSMPLAQWVKSHFNVWHFSLNHIYDRLRNGYSLEQALAFPRGCRRGFRMSKLRLRRLLMVPYITRKQVAAWSGWSEYAIRRQIYN